MAILMVIPVLIMVIGNGLLARKFSKYASSGEVIIFASGVSDSKLDDERAYEREVLLLKQVLQENPSKLLVYFSTCSLLDASLASNAYTTHKLYIENLIKANQPNYLIFRVSNIAGKGGNPKTIMNYLVNAIRHGHHFELWEDAWRNIIDIDDAYKIMDEMISQGRQNEIINIANPIFFNTKSIVSAIEDFTQKKAIYTAVKKGDRYFIDTTEVQLIAAKLRVNFADNYLSSILQKYYSNNDLPGSKN